MPHRKNEGWGVAIYKFIFIYFLRWGVGDLHCFGCEQCRMETYCEDDDNHYKRSTIQKSIFLLYLCYYPHTINKATGEHYNQPGHSASNMTVTILEKVKKH